ncbi:MAG: YggT family protein [Gordonia sp. (in: high G+C Gram-positive bacteria)]
MSEFLWILYLLLFVYWLLLLGRLVVEAVQSYARSWRPRGVVVVAIEVVFTLTDPPVKALRRVLKPVNLGQVRLDLSLFIVLIVVGIGMQIARHFAATTML